MKYKTNVMGWKTSNPAIYSLKRTKPAYYLELSLYNLSFHLLLRTKIHYNERLIMN